jgi:signal transduction histidine kinase
MFRLATLHDYGILDLLSTPQLDRITRVTAQVMRSDLSSLSLVDAERQWLKGAHGRVPDNAESREVSFCAHGLDSDDMLLVPDATLDPRFADNPLVLCGAVRSYFGAPVIAPNGMRLGMLCAASPHTARLPDADQLAALRDLAAMAMYEIETTRVRRGAVEWLQDAAGAAQRRNETRERLERAQRSRNEFLTTLSHELRTPLHGIIGYAGLIAQSQPDDRDVQAYAGEVAAAGQRLSGVVDELLMLVRAPGTSGLIDWQRVDLRALTEKSIRLVSGYAFKRKIRLTVRWTHDAVFATADAARLTQVMLQVLTNAIRASDEGGEVAIVLSIEGADWATATVANRGAAMTAVEIARAMTPLGQPCSEGGEGTGLGLPIARMLMERQHGALEMSSDPGLGTVVRLRLPGGRRPGDQVGLDQPAETAFGV